MGLNVSFRSAVFLILLVFATIFCIATYELNFS